MSVQERYHYNDLEDKLVIARSEDITSVIEDNKRAYNDFSGYKSEVFNLKASIPPLALEQWTAKHGIKWEEAMNDMSIIKRFINDPENRHFLRIPGKI